MCVMPQKSESGSREEGFLERAAPGGRDWAERVEKGRCKKIRLQP